MMQKKLFNKLIFKKKIPVYLLIIETQKHRNIAIMKQFYEKQKMFSEQGI